MTDVMSAQNLSARIITRAGNFLKPWCLVTGFEKQRRTRDSFGIDYIFTVYDTVAGICWSIQKGKQAKQPKNQNEGFAELRILATHMHKPQR